MFKKILFFYQLYFICNFVFNNLHEKKNLVNYYLKNIIVAKHYRVTTWWHDDNM